MPELNIGKLEEGLNINSDTTQNFSKIMNDIPMINEEEDIIKNNIDRANAMLDRVEREMDRGNFNSRMVEVFAKLIDSVTTAATQIQSSTYNADYLLLKQKLADLKELEVKAKVKSIAEGSKTNIGSQNIILSDRESILKMIKGE